VFQKLNDPLTVLTQKAVKIRKVTQKHLPYGVAPVNDQGPGYFLSRQLRYRRAGLFVAVNQHPVCVGPSVAGRGDLRSGQGIHHSGFTHAGAAEKADGQIAFLHGTQFQGELVGIFTERALLFRGERQESVASKKHPELIELPLQILNRPV